MTNAARISMHDYHKAAPQVFDALRALGQAVADSGLAKDLVELIKVRASQVNGCAYCLQFHLNEARKLALPAAKLDQLATWHESPVYSPRESAALAWTEALCRMPAGPVAEADYTGLQAQFSEKEIVFLTAAIANINAWNRICGPLHFAPPSPVAQPG